MDDGARVTLTDIHDPNYFHKVVDCQWACPAHTPVPEYIRLIADGRYSDAYMINWKSNVFPGILGRTCDRPCEPACRRGRVEKEPVAICRLKRVTYDYKDDVTHRMPSVDAPNGKRIALVGAGPASLAVARDLLPLGYECVIYDGDAQAGGMIRSQIPKFRLPEEVIDEEVGYITAMGPEMRLGRRVDSLKALLDEVVCWLPGCFTWIVAFPFNQILDLDLLLLPVTPSSPARRSGSIEATSRGVLSRTNSSSQRRRRFYFLPVIR